MSTQSSAEYQPAPEEDYMNPRQLAYFRRKLLDLRTTLLDDLQANSAGGMEENAGVGDQTDQASAESDRDINRLNHERMKLSLGKIDQALVRIDNGRYGFCEITGEPIGLDRLEAQPAAALSLAAQQQQERGAV